MSARGLTVSPFEEVTQTQGVARYRDQDYRELKAVCLSNGMLFEDPYFEAGPKSLGYNDLGPGSTKTIGLRWVRPKDICRASRPEFKLESFNRADICQGTLGNCWFLAAAASLTLNPKLLARIIPSHQSFHTDYAGIFHFQFWQYGQWVDVVVDDRLPFRDNELVFVRSETRQEFWASLLEKAYAKLNGSYEALSLGWMGEAFVDFTGGINERINLTDIPYNLFELMKKAGRQHSLMGASIMNKKAGDREKVRSDGLVIGHAYSVTGVMQVMLRHRRWVKLVRLRNPWGFKEWRGPWSDRSREWDAVEPAIKSQLTDIKEDGEFWMDFTDFQGHFDLLEICSLTPDSLDDDMPGKWTVSCHRDSWILGVNAGGCMNYRDTFNYNPRAPICLSEEDNDPDEEVGCNLLVSLMQNHRRQLKEFGQKKLTIGFSVFKIPDSLPTKTYVCTARDLVGSTKFQTSRSVVKRMKLPPGKYVIIPSTFAVGQEGEFTLRIFAEKQKSTWEVDDQIRADNIWTSQTNIPINNEIKRYFMKMGGQAISATMLQEILNQMLSSSPELKTNGFSLKACDKMVQLLDFNKNRKLEVQEFAQLWERITQWWKIFTTYDKDRSGTMDVFELRYALAAAGFHLNPKLYGFMNKKYMDSNCLVDFDSFISCLVELEGIFRNLKSLDKDGIGNINMLNSEVKIAFEM